MRGRVAPGVINSRKQCSRPVYLVTTESPKQARGRRGCCALTLRCGQEGDSQAGPSGCKLRPPLALALRTRSQWREGWKERVPLVVSVPAGGMVARRTGREIPPPQALEEAGQCGWRSRPRQAAPWGHSPAWWPWRGPAKAPAERAGPWQGPCNVHFWIFFPQFRGWFNFRLYCIRLL